MLVKEVQLDPISTSRCTRTSTASTWIAASASPCRSSSRASRAASRSTAACSISCTARSRWSACRRRFRTHRGRRHRARLNDAIYLRDLARDATWQPVTDPDTMLAHVVTLRVVEERRRRGAAAPVAAAPAARPSLKSSRRARPTRKARKPEKKKRSAEMAQLRRCAGPERMKLVVGLGNPGPNTARPGTTSGFR